MTDTVPEPQHPDDPTARATTPAPGAAGARPGVGRRPRSGGPALCCGLGGYALRGAVNSAADTRLAKLDVIESGQEQVAGSPFDARLRLGLADALRDSGRLNLALAEYDAVLENDPRRHCGALRARDGLAGARSTR